MIKSSLYTLLDCQESGVTIHHFLKSEKENYFNSCEVQTLVVGSKVDQ